VALVQKDTHLGSPRPSVPMPAQGSARLLVPLLAEACEPSWSAGVSLARGGEPKPAAWTSHLAWELDLLQCRTGRGPALDAAWNLQVFNVDVRIASGQWPGFARAAVAGGVLSALCVPVTAGGQVLGALSLYAPRPGAFARREEAGLRLAARVAGVLAPDVTTGPS
jgi:GAF domain-containing protein